MDLGCDASFAMQLMTQLSNPSPQLGAPSSAIVPPGPDAAPPKDGSGKKPKAKAKAPKEARLCRYLISDDADPCVPDVSVDSVF